MTAKIRATLLSDIATAINDNTTGDISAADVRTELTDLADSMLNPLSDVTHGTYTPTLTGITNVAASVAFGCQWFRVGDVVTVSGKCEIDPTTTSILTQLDLSLPVASNLATNGQCRGTISALNSGVAWAGQVTGETTNDRASLKAVPGNANNSEYSFIFSYLVV